MRLFSPQNLDHEHSRSYLVAVHIVFGLLFAGTLALVFGYVVMLLWNHLMPDLFRLPALTYWQGVGLLLLSRILAGGLGHGRAGHGHVRRPEERPAWKEYDAWWKAVGEQSFRQHTGVEGSGNAAKD